MEAKNIIKMSNIEFEPEKLAGLTDKMQELIKKVSYQEARIAEQKTKALEQDQRIQALEKMVFDLINKGTVI